MTSFRANPTFLARVAGTVLFNHAMDTVAERGLEFAKEHVRVDTGALKDSLHVEKDAQGVRRVVAGTDHWLFNEFGSRSDPGQPFLRPIIPFLRLHTRP